MVTVTLGSHTFQVPPTAKKSYERRIALVRIPDGVDEVHDMGRTNKVIRLPPIELSKAQHDDLKAQYESESVLTLDIPDFEDSISVRIQEFSAKESAGFEEQAYYRCEILVVKTT